MVKQWFKKWRKDKKWRNQIIMWIVIGYFVLNFTEFGTELQATWTPQSECNKYNSYFADVFGITSDKEKKDCEQADCHIQITWGINTIPIFPFITPGFISKCVSYVPTGSYTPEGAEACKELEADELSISDRIERCGTVFTKCYVCEPKGQGEESACKKWQKPFADFLDSVWKENKIESCSTKAYLVMGFGAFALLAVL